MADSLPPFAAIRDDDGVVLTATTDQSALQWLAVLGAAAIPYDLEHEDGLWQIVVAAEVASAALQQITEFESEAKYWPPREEDLTPYLEPAGVMTPFVCFALIMFFVISGPADAQSNWVTNGRGDAELMLAGEWWRCVTAMTLHADGMHLLANLVGCYLLGSAVCRYFGDGLGWFAVLLGGILGNVANAYVHSSDFRFLGASTAVFAALGVLGGIKLMRHAKRDDAQGHRRILPLLTVVAAVGLLGTSPGSDVTGHFLGALGGVVVGCACPLFWRIKNRPLWQDVGMLAFCSIIGGAWLLALN